nr:hypothetical protein [uncultured Anaerobutyricum sp.]
MINDLFRTYKKIILLLLVLLCSVVFWFYGCRRQQRSQSEVVEWNKKTIKGTNGYCYKFKTKNCVGTVTFGAVGYVARDKEMPVTLNISSIKKDFTGVMKITLPGENGRGIAYQSAVKCKEGKQEKIILNVPQLGNPSAICFEIMDTFGVTELSEDVSFSDAKNRNGAFSEQAENLICVLSGQSKKLSYLNSLKIEEESEEESVKVVCYSKNSFPQTEEEFQGLDGMLIDSFDTKSLSGKQKSALKSWLKSGGKLLIAGGGQQIDSFEGLEKTFGIIQEDVGVSELYLADADNTVQKLPILMSNLQLSQKYEWEAYGNFEPEIGYTAAVGSGKISILRFSLTNSAFLQWSVRDKAAGEILSHFMGKDEDTESSDTSLWYVKKALYAFMKSQLPNTFFYGVFFIFYILLMVTIAYYYLRKIKKREYIWIVVPVLALVFTVGLFIRSRGMKGSRDSYFSALRVTDSEKEQENIYFLYQNDEGVEDNVNFLSSITSVIQMDYNYRTIAGKNIKTSGEDITINNTQKGFDVAFEESVPGTSRILKLSGNTKSVSEKEVFTQDIFTTYTSFYGNITNTSSNNFSRVILIRGNQYAILKSVKAGEKASVSTDMVKCWNHFDEENSAFGTENENTVTGNIMEYLRQTYMNTQKSKEELLVVGITNENDFKLFSDDNVLKNHVTVMINHFALEEETGKRILNINMSCLKQEGEGLAIEEDTLEENKTEVSYVFDKAEEIEALTRNKDNFTGKIYAYNYSTGQRDRILSSTESYITGESLNNYLSGDGEMRITYKMDASDEYGPAPVLSLIYKKQ